MKLRLPGQKSKNTSVETLPVNAELVNSSRSNQTHSSAKFTTAPAAFALTYLEVSYWI